MHEQLANAEAYLRGFGFVIGSPLLDALGVRYGFVAMSGKRQYTVLAGGSFHLVPGAGVCKSLDVQAIREADACDRDLVVYLYDPVHNGQPPRAYLLDAGAVIAGGFEIEHFGVAGTEQRPKFHDVCFPRVGAYPLEAWHGRRPVPGEQFWIARFAAAGLPMRYVGSELQDPIYGELGFTPDFVALGHPVLVEVGYHPPVERQRRAALVDANGWRAVFIEEGKEYYNAHPAEADIRVGEVVQALRSVGWKGTVRGSRLHALDEFVATP